MMRVSVGVMAHNESHTVAGLLQALLDQKLKDVRIAEIIVVSSGSTDATDRIVSSFSKMHPQVLLVRQKARMGKAAAINEFLRRAKSEIVVLESADTLPEMDALEKLCAPLQDMSVGIVAARPVPKHDDTILGRVVALQWQLHHRIARRQPKFGELIAFRKVFDRIENTAVDEEYIAMRIRRAGFRLAYAPDAVVYNKGPTTLTDFLRQRRRVYCGHLILKRGSRHEAPTLSNWRILRIGLQTVSLAMLPTMAVAIVLEALGRLLGAYDCLLGRKHHVWAIAESTKDEGLTRPANV